MTEGVAEAAGRQDERSHSEGVRCWIPGQNSRGRIAAEVAADDVKWRDDLAEGGLREKLSTTEDHDKDDLSK